MESYTTPASPSLLVLLVTLFPQCSKATLRGWISRGRVGLDGVRVSSGKIAVRLGQLLTIAPKQRMIGKIIPIIYEDQDLVAIDKPEGLLTVSTAFETKKTAFALLKEHYHPRTVYVVHRLDRETSGVMLFALSERALRGLKERFASHDLERNYCAIVEGGMEKKSGEWRSYLYEDKNYFVHSSSDPNKGELAITHYRVDNRYKGYSRLQLTLETGKKNQIRAHCQQAGHSIVGDKKYGSHTNPIKRLALHATRLAVTHPSGERALEFCSPPPAAFFSLAP